MSPRERLDHALRDGRVDVVAGVAGNAADVDYRFDPTRPESRPARLAVDDVCSAAWRADVARVTGR